jgi:hypothetical protein
MRDLFIENVTELWQAGQRSLGSASDTPASDALDKKVGNMFRRWLELNAGIYVPLNVCHSR